MFGMKLLTTKFLLCFIVAIDQQEYAKKSESESSIFSVYHRPDPIPPKATRLRVLPPKNGQNRSLLPFRSR